MRWQIIILDKRRTYLRLVKLLKISSWLRVLLQMLRLIRDYHRNLFSLDQKYLHKGDLVLLIKKVRQQWGKSRKILLLCYLKID